MAAFELKHHMIFALIYKSNVCSSDQLNHLQLCIERIESTIKVSEFELLANLPNVNFL